MTTLPARTAESTAAEHRADHTALASKYNADRLWVPASAITNPSDNTMKQLGSTPFYGKTLDQTTDEMARVSVDIPPDWTTYSVYARLSTTATAGNVRVDWQGVTVAHGGDPTIVSFATLDTPSTIVVYDEFLTVYSATGLSAPAEDTHLEIGLLRDANHADDTLAADLWVLGFMFEKVT